MRLYDCLRGRAEPFAAMAIGLVGFLLILGPRVLDPGNIAWLGTGDPAQHYLGWLFYRQSGWALPLGLNPAYGLELASGIVFSDSIPMLALLFKTVSAVLPEVFQYFGIWLLGCFLLQGYFSYKLVRLVSTSTTVNLLGVILFVFAPPMLFRVAGHNSLVAHFLLLASLYLVLRPSNTYRTVSWLLLLCVASLVHPYLFVMVGALWVIDVAERTRNGEKGARQAVTELSWLVALLGLVVWQAGYFSVGGGAGHGAFGYYRMHPLSIIDPSGWSHALNDIPEADGTYEGFNYLGAGVLLLAVVALIPLLEQRTHLYRAIRARPFLGAGLVAFVLFSMSHRIGVQGVWFEVPLPDRLINVAGTFQSSGRFFWPVYYVIYLVILYLIVRGYRPPVAITVLALGVCVQVVDTSAGWGAIRDSTMGPRSASWDVSMESAFWDRAADRYQKTRSLPVKNKGQNWQAISYYSGVHGLATNAVYLARVDSAGLARARKAAQAAMRSGQYSSDSLYFVAEDLLPLVSRNLDRSRDLLARIDGYYVIAPDWKECSDCPSFGREVVAENHEPEPVALDRRIEFGEGRSGNSYLDGGWSHPESWGIWTEGELAGLVFPVKDGGRVERIVVEGSPFLGSDLDAQRIGIQVNGVDAAPVTLSDSAGERFTLQLTDGMRQRAAEAGAIRVTLVLHDAVSPAALGVNADERRLAFGLEAVTVHGSAPR
ncbi:DUF6311 domain-containing protein [Halomonadaceae bacterium KBTZ08]